jgi:PGF-CTERM protein
MARTTTTVVLGCLFALGFVAAGMGVVTGGSTLQEMEGSGTADDPYVITDAEELQAMEDDLDAHYELGNDIDASETADWNGGDGFEPIGTAGPGVATSFTGSLDGQGHTIRGLTIDRSSENEAVIGKSTGVVENVAFEAAEIDGVRHTAVVVGANEGTIRNVSVSGEVSGGNAVGGVAGVNDGTVTESTSRATVSGTEAVGGLVGDNSGDVTGSYAVEAVSGTRNVGGLIGTLHGTVTNSYATGNVSGENSVGGLVGYSWPDAGDELIETTYATGHVDGNGNVGGLVGHLQVDASSSFAAGPVEGTFNVGGVIGRLGGPSPSDLPWDRDATGQENGIGGGSAAIQGASTDELTGLAATEHDFYDEATWTATDSYPVFDWQLRGAELAIADSPVVAGNVTRATVTVDLNDGRTVTASETASYDVDTSVATVEEGRIEARAAGETDVTASVGEFSDSATIAVQAPAAVSLVNATLAAEGTVSGSGAAVVATLENTGDVPGSAPVAVTVEGEEVVNETVTVAADDEETVTLGWNVDEGPGEYDVSVGETDVGALTVIYGTAVTLSDVTAPDAVTAGEVYEIEASFENEVDVELAIAITYAVGDDEQERVVTLEPGSSTVTFTETAPDSAGESVEHTVAYRDSSKRATTDVVAPASFSVAALDGPESVEAGGTIEITATVENTGEMEGTTQLEITVGGETVATETVSLAGGETTEVTATAPVADAESITYSARVDGDEQSESASVEDDGNGDENGGTDDGGTDDGDTTDDSETDDDGTTDDSEADDDGAGFGFAVAAIAVLSAALLAARRR